MDLHDRNDITASAVPDGSELAPISIEQTLLRQKVVASLRRAIELGGLKPGQRLIEKDLCGRLAVSRTSLREALRDLEANGVVTKVSARELVITRLTPEDTAALYDIRGAIEAVVVEQFILHGDETAVAAMRQLITELRHSDPATGSYLDAQREYYRIWCHAARNPHAFEYLTNLQLRLSSVSSGKLRKPELLTQNIDEKEKILACMARRDRAAALAALRDHIRNAKATALPPPGP